jgi:hypothetical protein
MMLTSLMLLLLVGTKGRDVEIDIEFYDIDRASRGIRSTASSLQTSADTDMFQQSRSNYP